MTKDNCPDLEVLDAFLLGKSTGKIDEDLESHFANCAACLSKVETLSGNDALTNAIRQRNQQFESDAVLAEVIEQGKQIRPPEETIATSDVPTDSTFPHRQNPSRTMDLQELRFLQPAQQPDELGRLGGYRVLEVLGAGGMGVVFRAEDPRLNRIVALKVMKPADAADVTAKERFLREAQATAAIEHDHIVPIYQVGEDAGVPFIAMQFLKGESLKQRLERSEPLNGREALRIAREVAQGLAAAHERGLIHRDIKPDNLWLESGTNRVKIVDFGLVRKVTPDAEITQSGMILGTPQYMSPEQARGKPVDARTDLFSLGVVLYQMLTNCKAFQRESLLGTLVAIEREHPQPPAEINPLIPAAVNRLVLELLEKDPARRPQSAHEVAMALTELASSELETVTLASPPTPLHRKTWAVWLLPAVVLLLGVIIITIKNKDGQVEQVVTVPDGGSFEAAEKESSIPPQPNPKLQQPEQKTARIAPATQTDTKALGPLPMVQNPDPLTSRDGEVIQSHTLETVPIMGWVVSAVSPDGKYVATFSDDGMIRIWDPHSLELVHMLVSHTSGPMRVPHSAGMIIDPDSLIWNPDSRRLAAASFTGELRIWDVETSELLGTYRHETSKLKGFRWSPDGTVVAARFEDPTVRILSSEGKLVSELEHLSGTPRHIAWAKDSRNLAVGLYREADLFLWDVSTGKAQKLKMPAVVYPDERNYEALAWSPDGKQIAVCCQRLVVVCQPDSGKVETVLENAANTLAWSLDGSQLFIGHDNKISRISNRMELKPIELPDQHPAHLTSLTPLPDGKQLLVKFHFAGHGLVNLETGEVRPKLGELYDSSYQFLQTSQDGSVCVLSSSISSSARVLTNAIKDPQAKWRALPAQSNNISRIACSATGRYIASFANYTAIIDRSQEKLAPQIHKSVSYGTYVLFSPNEKFLFTSSQQGTCRIASVDGSQQIQFETKDVLVGSVWTADYAPDGKEIALAGHDGVSIHNTTDGKPRLSWKYSSGLPTADNSVAWSPDGRLLAVTTHTHQPSRVYIYDAQTGKELHSLSNFPEFRERIGHVTWSPDSHYLAVTGDWGPPGPNPDPLWFNQLVVWETKNWDAVFTRPVMATAMRFEDENTLVYSTRDGLVLRENVQTGKEVHRVQAGVGGQITRFTPDGKQVLHVNGDRISVRNLSDGKLQATILPNVSADDLHPAWAVISPKGHYLGSSDAYKYFRHIVQTKAGERFLTPFEFRNEFRWKNDPDQVHLQAPTQSDNNTEVENADKNLDPLSPLALTQTPAKIAGLKSWSLETRLHRSGISLLQASNDGHFLASAGYDGTIRIWQTEDVKPAQVLHLDPPREVVRDMAWSRDGNYFAHLGNRWVTIYQTSDWQKVFSWETDSPSNFRGVELAWSQRGLLLVAFDGSGRNVAVIDVEQKRVLRKISNIRQPTQWEQDSESILIGRLIDGSVHTLFSWDVHTNQQNKLGTYHYYAFYSPDRSRYFVSNAEKKQWEVKASRDDDVLCNIPWPEEQPGNSNLSWSLDGRHLTWIDWGKQERKIIAVETGKTFEQVTLPPSLAEWLPNGKEIAIFSNTRFGNLNAYRAYPYLQIVNLETGKSRAGRVTQEGVRMDSYGQYRQDGPWIQSALVWSPDGTQLMSQGHSISRWDIRAGQFASPVETKFAGSYLLGWPESDTIVGTGHPTNSPFPWTHNLQNKLDRSEKSVGFYWGNTTDARTLVYIENDQKTVHFVDGLTQKQIRQVKLAEPHEGGWDWLWGCVSPLGDRLATMKRRDPNLKIWDLRDGTLLQTLNVFSILGDGGFEMWAVCKFSPNSQRVLLIVKIDQQTLTLLWDLSEQRLIRKLSLGIPWGTGFDVAWIDEDRFVHTTFDQGIQLFDRDGNELKQWKDAGNQFGTISLSPDRSRIACTMGTYAGGSKIGHPFIQIRDLKDGRIISTHCVLPTEYDYDLPLSFSPTGHWSGPKELRDVLSYVIITEDGNRLLLTPEEFEQQFNWNNDPSRVGDH